MLSGLINALAPTRPPSAVIVVGTIGAHIKVLHLVPEDGACEFFGGTIPSTHLRSHGVREQTREQVGTVTVYAGDGESASGFMKDVAARAKKLWAEQHAQTVDEEKASSVPCDEEAVAQLVQDVLKPAALGAIRDREGREPSVNATQAFPVFVVSIKRPRPGRILPTQPFEPTSIHL